MNLETLAQDVSDKRQDMLYKHIALSEAEMLLFNAQITLSDALRNANGSDRDQVAIALKNHIVVCKWDPVAVEYTMKFIPKATNANS